MVSGIVRAKRDLRSRFRANQRNRRSIRRDLSAMLLNYYACVSQFNMPCGCQNSPSQNRCSNISRSGNRCWLNTDAPAEFSPGNKTLRSGGHCTFIVVSAGCIAMSFELFSAKGGDPRCSFCRLRRQSANRSQSQLPHTDWSGVGRRQRWAKSGVSEERG